MAAELEFFRTQHCHHQVDEAGQRNQADEEIFHDNGSGKLAGGLTHFPAEIDVGDRQGEKAEGHGDEKKVIHGAIPVVVEKEDV
jgi:hypothetical protein